MGDSLLTVCGLSFGLAKPKLIVQSIFTAAKTATRSDLDTALLLCMFCAIQLVVQLTVGDARNHTRPDKGSNHCKQQLDAAMSLSHVSGRHSCRIAYSLEPRYQCILNVCASLS